MELKDASGKVVATLTAVDTNVDTCDEGVWLTVNADDGTQPTLCLVKDKAGGSLGGSWYLGVHRDSKKPGIGCDLAILFGKDGPTLQVIRGSEAKTVNLFDLIAGKGA